MPADEHSHGPRRPGVASAAATAMRSGEFLNSDTCAAGSTSRRMAPGQRRADTLKGLPK